VDPVPDPLLLRKSGSAGNLIRGLWICSQKLCPLDHRGGLRPHKRIKQIYLLLKLEVKKPFVKSSLLDYVQRCSAEVITRLSTQKVQSSLKRVVTDLQIKMP
jgi:hypothetical protein